ncbi:hypothetical protein QBC42DRAFT_219670 [Cladorrhinum samala]|uniref:Peptidase M20 domain-containing protein 2 n=1 Tax=Cladorrhinum samala TaxID=585594 RepID=A0AAV9HWE2_9PEZI|nr:hypothetical protein QBC42DRAFT_219670 [Cladorrhinum samala]
MEEDGFIIVPKPNAKRISNPPDFTTRDDDDGGDDGDDAPHFLSEIDSFVNTVAEKLWPLNRFIHQNPELAYKEHKAHDALTSFFQTQPGWVVTRSAYGIPTAWTALFSSPHQPGPTVSFNVEMDALPNLGHACGHNLIATASLAAGLATARVMSAHGLPGRVLILGTPGEEGHDGAKIRLLKAGAYSGVDVSLISHPGILNNSPLVRTTAFARFEVEYFGLAAHGANSPWKGINALDALVVAYNAVSVLRQQTMPDDVIGLSITNGGGPAANVIHAYASGVCVIRASSSARLKVLQAKVEGCFKAGGEATGAEVKIKVIEGYKDHVPNRVLAGSYARYWNKLDDVPEPRIPEGGRVTWVKASTDQGNLSYALPSVNASFAIPPGPERGQPHSRDFEVAAGRREAFDRALRVGKALAGTAVDVLSVEGRVAEVWKEWRRDMERMKEYNYESFGL